MMMTNALIILLLLVFLLGCAYIIRFHWSRREMYRLASKIKDTVPSYPIIGSAYYFIGPPGDFQNLVNQKLEEYFPLLGKGWLGPFLFIAVSNPDHLEVIFNSKHCLNKNDAYHILEVLLGNGLITAKENIWKKNRKLIQPTFNLTVLNQFVQTFAKNSEIFVDILKKNAGKGNFDVFLPASYCTLDNILETGIGLKVNTQTSDFQYSQWLSKALEFFVMRVTFPPFFYDFIFNLSPLGRELAIPIKKMKDFIGKIVEEKRKAFEENNLDFKDGGRHKAFLDLLLELEDEGTHFTNKQISDEVHTMIAAGMETSAISSSFILIMLGMFPDLQQKVYDEVIDLLGQDRSITADDLPHLKYTEMFIKETMRLFPAVPHFARTPTQNIKLGTTIIPKGSNLYISTLHTHRSGHIWKDPLTFNPERFSLEESAKRHPYSYVPFAGGPRNCIGMKYAMMLVKTITATIIRQYKISTPYKNIEDIELGSDAVLRAKRGFNISIEERHL